MGNHQGGGNSQSRDAMAFCPVDQMSEGTAVTQRPSYTRLILSATSGDKHHHRPHYAEVESEVD